MDKKTFLRQLKRQLRSIGKEERQHHLNFYEEMINDRMEEGYSEYEAVFALGSVKEIAQKILSECAPVRKHSILRYLLIAIAAVFVLIAGLVILLGVDRDMKEETYMIATTLVPFQAKENEAVNTIYTEEAFANINVQGDVCSVEIRVADAGFTRITYADHEDVRYEIWVEDGTLYVKRVDERPLPMRISTTRSSVTIYLNDTVYNTLKITTASGIVTVGSTLSFQKVSIESTSGSVRCLADIKKEIEISTNSGSIEAACQNAQMNKAVFTTTSGKIGVYNMTADQITVKSTSGTASLTDVYAQEKMQIKTISGNIILTRCDGNDISLTSTSGNVTATLLTPKTVTADSTNGNVKTPSLQGEGVLRAKTTSGDIEIKVIP